MKSKEGILIIINKISKRDNNTETNLLLHTSRIKGEMHIMTSFPTRTGCFLSLKRTNEIHIPVSCVSNQYKPSHQLKCTTTSTLLLLLFIIIHPQESLSFKNSKIHHQWRILQDPKSFLLPGSITTRELSSSSNQKVIHLTAYPIRGNFSP